MGKRQSINGRMGNIPMSSVIGGATPGTRETPATLEEQLANVFGYMRKDVEAAGGTGTTSSRLNAGCMTLPGTARRSMPSWVKMFPDSESRPARHTRTSPAGGSRMGQAVFTAVIG